MKNLKRVLVLFLSIILTFAGSTMAFASDQAINESDINSVSSNISQTGGFFVNNKYYSCSTSFVWTKASTSKYYAGMYSFTEASTTRKYSLSVKANTRSNGYITYSGTASNTGTNTLYQKKIITINQPLNSPNYKSWAGSCQIYYNNVLKWTGAIYG